MSDHPYRTAASPEPPPTGRRWGVSLLTKVYVRAMRFIPFGPSDAWFWRRYERVKARGRRRRLEIQANYEREMAAIEADSLAKKKEFQALLASIKADSLANQREFRSLLEKALRSAASNHSSAGSLLLRAHASATLVGALHLERAELLPRADPPDLKIDGKKDRPS